MKARISLTFVALVFCGNGYASPCKPSPSTTATVTSSEISTTASTLSTAESSATTFSSAISESASAVTTAITSAAESSTTILITSDAPTTTTTVEESSPSNLFINPSFDNPNDQGNYDGSPWVMEDAVSPLSISINPSLGHTGSHSAYWSIANTAQAGTVYQRKDLENDGLYKVSYWWFVDEIDQPRGLETCYISMVQEGVDGLTTSYPDFLFLPTNLPLSTWTKREFLFNPMSITPAFLKFSVACYGSAGSGLKIAIDDITLTRY